MKSRHFKTRNGTDLTFSAIGLGTAPMGDLYELLDEKTSIATIEQAYASGIRIFDTSPHYGNGLAESRVGAGLRRAVRDEVIVSTKIGRVMDPFGKPPERNKDAYSPGFAGGYPHAPRFDYSYDGTMPLGRAVAAAHGPLPARRAADPRLRRLDARRGRCAAPLQGGDGRPPTRRSTSCAARRRFAAIGFGINEADTCVKFARAGDFDVAMMAGPLLAADPERPGRIPSARAREEHRRDAGGRLQFPASWRRARSPAPSSNTPRRRPEIMDKVRRIEAICAAHGTSIRRAALQFAMAHPAVVSVVLGGVRPNEPEANAIDADATVPPALWSDLKAAGLLDPSAPTA